MSDVNNLRWNVPPKPAVATQHEFDMMSPEQQAAILHGWQDFWLKPAPAVDVRSGSGIVIPEPPAQSENWNGKQPPTQAERESTRNESWK